MNIWNFFKAQHTFVWKYPTVILAKFRKNLTNLRTLLIHLNRGCSSKNKPRFFGSKTFYTFSHLINAGVNAVMPTTNENRHKAP